VIQIYTYGTGKKLASGISALIKYENRIMKKIKTATAAMVLSALSFGVFAADNMTQPLMLKQAPTLPLAPSLPASQ